MSRKTATATKEPQQPDLLGGAQAKPAPAAKPIAKIEPAAKRKAESKSVAISEPPGPKNILAVIAEAASNPKVNPENMRLLLDMQKEIMAEEARLSFIADFIALQVDLPSIRQDGKIEIREKDATGRRTENSRVQQATPYATFNNIMRTIKPLLHKHNFTLSFATEPAADGARILVKGFLDHGRGHQRTTAFPLPAEVSGSKNNVQGWGSSMSYGKRYATIALLNIVSHAPEDTDRNGATPPQENGRRGGDAKEIEGQVVDEVPKITTKQHDELVDAIEACGAKRSDFCDAYRIDKVADLPAEMFGRAMKACRDRNKEKARG